MKKLTIGLIGAIGAGKSAAAAVLARLGGAVVDADAVGHAALELPAVRERLAARWGNVLKDDGRVDRRKIAEIVFRDPAERTALEAIVFPSIRRLCEEAMAAGQADPAKKIVVLDAAVLIEAGWKDVCDKLIYVDAPHEVRVARVAARSGWTEAELLAREAAQMPAEEKKKHAHVILNNATTRDDLADEIERILLAWTA
ncbi:dephospho-CoA kinase [Limnoglobus roseus]|uniref:Dephospho-CoA kinase n=1 Tax=Limnoglobus roseus TaxID=2598579 RepID=A0A5C1ASU2_9BACT|nr:dephospho-CoA kinase [Limnoglobus roseus]QEL20324.1 dephospho-CoA kinase [Limnoglobus roseus]